MEQQAGIVDAVRDAFNDTQTADLKILVDGKEIYAHKVDSPLNQDYFSNFRLFSRSVAIISEPG